MKVMIAYPALHGKGSPMLTQNRQFQWYHEPSYIYPVVSASAATLLQARGHQVIWYDGIAQKKTPDDFFRVVGEERPDLVVMESKPRSSGSTGGSSGRSRISMRTYGRYCWEIT